MMSTAILVAFGILLVLLLLLIARRKEVEEREGDRAAAPAQCECRNTLQRPELVLRIFSREDSEFVLQMRSPWLQRMYK